MPGKRRRMKIVFSTKGRLELTSAGVDSGHQVA